MKKKTTAKKPALRPTTRIIKTGSRVRDGMKVSPGEINGPVVNGAKVSRMKAPKG